MLRAKSPDELTKRLKMFVYGAAGVGKTRACIQFPNSYIIDGERGCENYSKLIKASGSAVFPTADIDDVTKEVKALLTERHDFRTLVVDPITPIYIDLLEKCEKKVGEAHGKHFGLANKTMKRLTNLLMALDMTVIITAHQKAVYAKNMEVIGNTYDAFRGADYFFDLVLELRRDGKRRVARVVKTRIDGFPADEEFEWSYEEVKNRYGASMLEKAADVLTLASPAQVAEIKQLLAVVKLPDGVVEKWFAKAAVEDWQDMPSDVMSKIIEYVKGRIPNAAA